MRNRANAGDTITFIFRNLDFRHVASTIFVSNLSVCRENAQKNLVYLLLFVDIEHLIVHAHFSYFYI